MVVEVAIEKMWIHFSFALVKTVLEQQSVPLLTAYKHSDRTIFSIK